MSNKELKLKGRVQNKHKTEEAWLLDVYPDGDITLEPRVDAFIPLDGELIIYDPDSVYTERRIKIGDGRTNVVALPFQKENHTVYSRGLDYTLSDDGTYYSVTGIGTCEDIDIIISPTYNGLPVKEIGNNAFDSCEQIVSVVIPNSVISIGSYTFYYCTSLTNITIPDSVTSIGNFAFYECTSLTSIEIPNSMTSIGGSTFCNCLSLTSIVIHDSVTSIGKYAFWGCLSLTIYCEAESKPDGWDEGWNPDDYPVVWGFANDFIAIDEKINNLKKDIDGSSESIVGAWVFHEGIDLSRLGYDESRNLSFIANGHEYVTITKTSIGSSSWNINGLAYFNNDGDALENGTKYIHNPSGGYGINHGWQYPVYKTIFVTKETDSQNTANWLRENADKVDGLQPKADPGLKTIDKTIVGAINEIDNIVSDNITGSSFLNFQSEYDDEGNEYYIVSGLGIEIDETLPDGNLIIPRTYQGAPVKKVRSFYHNDITSVFIPNSVTMIDDYTFTKDNGTITIYCEALTPSLDWPEHWDVNGRTNGVNPVYWGCIQNLPGVFGAVKELDKKTIDKVCGIDAYTSKPNELSATDNISWRDNFVFYNDKGNPAASGEIYHRIPIVAGDNVEFEVDEEDQVVKINASGETIQPASSTTLGGLYAKFDEATGTLYLSNEEPID